MEFAFGFRITPRRFPISFSRYVPISLFTPPVDIDVTQRERAIQLESSRLRRRVLRRDHYGCRGCDRDGLEVTLAVHAIHPDAIEEEDMLTLCRQCFEIVEQKKIVAGHTPEFLRRLWLELHPATSPATVK